MNTCFKTGFEKTAFIGAIARGAGKLTSAAGKGARATVTGAGNLAEKARVHTKGFGEYLKKNYQAGQAGKPGISYKGAVSNVKRQETMAARKSAVEASKAKREVPSSTKPDAKQGPKEISQKKTKEAPKKNETPTQQVVSKVKEHISKVNPRIQGGAVGLAAGGYAGHKITQNNEGNNNVSAPYGVQYA